MVTVPGFPYFAVEFDKRGRTAAPGNEQVRALKEALAAGEITDLIVISHGWNNNMREAEDLYRELLRNARALIDAGRFTDLLDRKFVVLGVLWPSKKFEDEELIPSGAAGVVNTVLGDAVSAQIAHLQGAFDAADGDAKLAQLTELLPQLEGSYGARERFVGLCRSLVETRSKDDEAQSNSFFEDDPLEVFNRLANPASFTEDFLTSAPSADEGGAAGMGEGGTDDGNVTAAGLGDFFSGALSAARNALNYTTYYQMKERAGLIGNVGVKPLLQEVRRDHPALRLHMIGHSFGGRLVAATVAGKDQHDVLPVSSMTLLQAAFSHHGFSSDWDDNGSQGFFCSVIEHRAVTGPLVITHTRNDKAVGIAYPLASLLARQAASGLGDENSRYGGIGRNGAQKMAAVDKVAMIRNGVSYPFTRGRLHNVLADDCIDDHGDVSNSSVAGIVLATIAAA